MRQNGPAGLAVTADSYRRDFINKYSKTDSLPNWYTFSNKSISCSSSFGQKNAYIVTQTIIDVFWIYQEDFLEGYDNFQINLKALNPF